MMDPKAITTINRKMITMVESKIASSRTNKVQMTGSISSRKESSSQMIGWIPVVQGNSAIVVLFGLQLQLVVGISIFFGKEALSGITDMVDSQHDFGLPSFWRLMILSPMASMVSCIGFLTFAIKYSRKLVIFSFFATPVALACVGLASVFYTRQKIEWESAIFILKVAAAIFLLMGIAYRCCQTHMPFAASTLHVALMAVWDNSSLFQWSLVLTLLNNIWIVAWSTAATGVYYWAKEQRELVPCRAIDMSDYLYVNVSSFETNLELLKAYSHSNKAWCEKEYSLHPGIGLFFVISLYWTQQMFKHVLHTTTASEIGDWWRGVSPATNPRSSLLTVSFESLCLHSFSLPLLRVLRQFVPARRDSQEEKDEGSHDRTTERQEVTVGNALLDQICRLTEYADSWSFVGLGLYGHDFVSAGRTVKDVFESRGWTYLLDDQVAYRVMLLCNFAIAAASGSLAWIVDALLGGPATNGESSEAPHNITFIVAFVCGWIMGNRLLIFIEGSVRTMISCFTETFPKDDFKKTRLAFELKKGWQEVYPNLWK